jgi:hypothetical protein
MGAGQCSVEGMARALKAAFCRAAPSNRYLVRPVCLRRRCLASRPLRQLVRPAKRGASIAGPVGRVLRNAVHSAHVWYLGKSGKHMLAASFSHFDRPCVKTPDARIGARKSRREWALSRFLFLCGFCTGRFLAIFSQNGRRKKWRASFHTTKTRCGHQNRLLTARQSGLSRPRPRLGERVDFERLRFPSTLPPTALSLAS